MVVDESIGPTCLTLANMVLTLGHLADTHQAPTNYYYCYHLSNLNMMMATEVAVIHILVLKENKIIIIVNCVV